MQETQSTKAGERTLIAKCVTTGMYFNGTAFEEFIPEKALALRPGTTAADFKLMWATPVDVIVREDEIATLQSHNPNRGRKSLAQRIHDGELDPHGAARVYVIHQRLNGQRSFSIRTATGEYISRVVKVEETGPSRCAWIKYCGNECAIVWKGGELALEWGA